MFLLHYGAVRSNFEGAGKVWRSRAKDIELYGGIACLPWDASTITESLRMVTYNQRHNLSRLPVDLFAVTTLAMVPYLASVT
jgi:hypothetical protein